MCILYIGDNGTAIQPPGSTKAGEVMRPKDQIRPPSNEQGNSYNIS